MKEYKIEMRYQKRHGGEWISAKHPDGRLLMAGHPYKTREDAEQRVEKLREEYPVYVEKFNRCIPESEKIKEIPVDFRIISREVTEWEAET